MAFKTAHLEQAVAVLEIDLAAEERVYLEEPSHLQPCWDASEKGTVKRGA